VHLLPVTWIPLTIFAAFAQTIRNAAQRQLVAELGTLGATFVRFLYGLPFAVAWLAVVLAFTALPAPAAGAAFIGWTMLGGVSQIAGTALMLRTMEGRNFAVGVAYSRTEVVQVAAFSMIVFGESLNLQAAMAVVCGTVAVLLLGPPTGGRFLPALMAGLSSRSAALGLACGACMAMSSIGFQGATRALGSPSFLLNAAFTLAVGLAFQTLLLGAWLWLRSRDVLLRTFGAWRRSAFAGFMGAAASAGWFSAFALQPATYVRTLGLIEMVFSYLVSRRFFREQLSSKELWAMALLGGAVILITTSG